MNVDSKRIPLVTRVGRVLTVLMTVGGVVAAAITLVPVWPFTLFEHFRVLYLIAGLIAVCAAGAFRMRGYFDACVMATLLELCAITPGMRAAVWTMPVDGVRVRVLFLNVETQSTGYAAVRRLIADVDPDVIGLVEVDRRWLIELAPSLVTYRGRFAEPRNDNFGVALYARHDVDGAIEVLGGSLPTVVAKVVHGGAHFSVVVTHPFPPLSAGAATALDAHFAAISMRVRSLDAPIMVMGDFNATPWSRVFVRFLDSTGLCDSRAGFGLQASWPAGFTPLRIPIDHVLASCSIGVRDRRIEREVGSDHLPVVVEFVVPRG